MLMLPSARLTGSSAPVATGWLMGCCMEARGKQDLWMRQKPEVLEVLRERAMIQSVESSNRIEGVTIEPHRLRPVIIDRDRPRDRSEEELSGYRAALDYIFSMQRELQVTPAVILELHRLSQGGFSGDAGMWKRTDNEIIEIKPNGERIIRFVATTAKETPAQMSALCTAYQDRLREDGLPHPLAAATFIFDFLCVHPFRDGNGRVSRLLTTMLLEGQGFRVARYVSLERLVEQTKDEYYAALNRCSQGWHEGKNEIVPWWNYFFTILRRAYGEFESQVGRAPGVPAKGGLIREVVLKQSQVFAVSDIAAQVPTVSTALIKKVLNELKEEGRVQLEGKTRAARWRVVP